MRPLRIGRHNNKNFLAIWRRFHFIVFSKAWGANAYGMTFKFRSGDLWSCWTIKFLQKHSMDMKRWKAQQDHTNKRYKAGKLRYPGRANATFYGRGSITLFEIEHWHTRGDSHTRIGLKSYLRLKFCPGGRQD